MSGVPAASASTTINKQSNITVYRANGLEPVGNLPYIICKIEDHDNVNGGCYEDRDFMYPYDDRYDAHTDSVPNTTTSSTAGNNILGGGFDNCNKAADFKWQRSATECLLLYGKGENYSPSNGVEWTGMNDACSTGSFYADVYFNDKNGAGHRVGVPSGSCVAFANTPITGSPVDLVLK
ncbi:MAG: hypothetical protein LBI63_01695 [Candidatus Ancillula sp.]|jgi:hypothetical protein|nr:hypothetical protein [Candidatus Ancillula sp.]